LLEDPLCGTQVRPVAPSLGSRFRGEADMHPQAKLAESVENDPSATSAPKFAVMQLGLEMPAAVLARADEVIE
jgi:hypothetical protein